MEDSRIVELYWQRNEAAIAHTQEKYEKYCYAIAKGILNNDEDANECVNDTYMGAWNAMPPNRPAILSTFLGKITRRISLKKYRSKSAEKRGSGETALALEELEECIASERSIDEQLSAKELAEMLNAFLDMLKADERRVFLRRYWFFDSIEDISTRFGFSQSKVKMLLKRTRDKLRAQLEKEDIWL